MGGSQVIVVSTVVLWVVVLVLALLVVLLYRQFGLLYIGSRARVELSGLKLGERAPAEVELEDDERRPLPWSWASAGEGRATAMIFGSEGCTLCDKLIPQLEDFASDWRFAVDTIFVDREANPKRGFRRRRQSIRVRRRPRRRGDRAGACELCG